MKKIYKENKHKTRNHKHSHDQLIRNLDHKNWKRKSRIRAQGEPLSSRKREKNKRDKFKSYKKIIAPQCFSFLKNPDEIIGFISRLKTHFDKKDKVFVIFKNTSEIDYGAIVVLLSIMVKFKSQGLSFNGDFPDDHYCRNLLLKSGFIDNLFKDFKPEDRYKIAIKKSDGIHTHAWKNVDSTLGSKIITCAANTIWGEDRRCQGVQRTLIELMQNTNNHADIGKMGEKYWWLSVNHNRIEKKVMFSFVDFGVGIFTNLNNKTDKSKFYNWTDKLAKKFKHGNNAELLKLILEGHLHQTVTGKHYRGKGLPGISEALRRNQISNLHIISNNVYCDVKNNTYKILTNSFSGTFVYWEIGENNESCK